MPFSVNIAVIIELIISISLNFVNNIIIYNHKRRDRFYGHRRLCLGGDAAVLSSIFLFGLVLQQARLFGRGFSH